MSRIKRVNVRYGQIVFDLDAVYGGKLCEYVLFFPIRKEYIHNGNWKKPV